MKDNKREPIGEYINRRVHPEWAKKVFQEFNEEKKALDYYENDLSFFADKRLFVPKVLEDVHAELQFLTYIEDGVIFLNAFLAGDGFFCYISSCAEMPGASVELIIDGKTIKCSNEVSSDDYIYECDERYDQMTLNGSGELCIPLCNEKKRIKNVGRTTEDRDFRKYNILDNIKWALMHSEMYKDSVDSAAYSGPGIEMYIDNLVALELAYHNCHEIMVIDGILEYDDEQRAVIVRD